MAGSEPFENPLVPNARLRQMLLAMHRLRAVERALPLKSRSGLTGLEACLVAPSIDLGPDDLLSDALTGNAIRFLRGTPLAGAVNPSSRSKNKQLTAGSGAAHPLVVPPRHEDRFWISLGAAAALRAHSPTQGRRPALVYFLRKGQISPATLLRGFQLAAEQHLPVLFIALPASLRDHEPAPGGIGRLATRAGIPGMAADRDDAVALYRVAQESLGRARAGGGPALIHCVPFALAGSRSTRQTTDPLSVIEAYILERKIVTPEWIAREVRTFARHLAQPLH